MNKKLLNYLKKNNIAIYEVPKDLEEQVKTEMTKKFQEIKWSFKNLLKITLWITLFLSIAFFAFGLITVLYLNQNVKWFQENNQGNGAIVFIACFIMMAAIWILPLVVYNFHRYIDSKKIIQKFDFQWLSDTVKKLLRNENEVKISSLSIVPEQPCLFLSNIFPYQPFPLTFSQLIITNLFATPSIARRKLQNYITEVVPLEQKRNLGSIGNWNKPVGNHWTLLEPAINGVYKGINFSFGTYYAVNVVQTNRSRYKVIKAFYYINWRWPNSKVQSIRVKVKPELKIDFIARHQAEKEGLESTEFENKYKISSYKYPIALRKIFNPKVMQSILDKEKKLPHHFGKTKRPIFKFINSQSSSEILSRSDWYKRHATFQLKIILKRKKFVETNYYRLIWSISIMNQALTWLECFLLKDNSK